MRTKRELADWLYYRLIHRPLFKLQWKLLGRKEAHARNFARYLLWEYRDASQTEWLSELPGELGQCDPDEQQRVRELLSKKRPC